MSETIEIVKRKILRAITKVYDPLIELLIGNQGIKVPLSHPLKENIKHFPDINCNLPRIIKYSLNFIKDVKLIDIGANIGDTVPFIKNEVDIPILCIDAEDKYLKILKQNVAKYNNVTVCKALVGEETKTANVKLTAEEGSGKIEKSSTSTWVRTLDNILEEYATFKDAKFLKIDTDGYDTLIIKGSTNYLKSVKPILFFEFDPHYISVHDDPYTFMSFLNSIGYEYFMFYLNNGEFLVSCDSSQKNVIDGLVHFFSGRNLTLFADICAFTEDDKQIFDYAVKEEIAHFRKQRKY